MSVNLYTEEGLKRIAGSGGFGIVDTELSSSSENPVQNKVLANLFQTKTLHVDGVNGSDSNTGLSKEQAFKTIQKAVDTCSNLSNYDFSTIMVYDGTYNEQVNVEAKTIKFIFSITGDVSFGKIKLTRSAHVLMVNETDYSVKFSHMDVNSTIVYIGENSTLNMSSKTIIDGGSVATFGVYVSANSVFLCSKNLEISNCIQMFSVFDASSVKLGTVTASREDTGVNSWMFCSFQSTIVCSKLIASGTYSNRAWCQLGGTVHFVEIEDTSTYVKEHQENSGGTITAGTQGNAQVVISTTEPLNKNAVWICPQ